MSDQIEGRNPVLEALRAGRELNRLFVARGSREGSIRAIVALAREKGVPVVETDRERLDRMSGGRPHQGVIATVAAFRYSDVDEILARAKDRGEDPLVLLLDGVLDPQNLGSLLRSADAAGAHGVIIPERRAAPLTAAVAKASAGAIEHVPVARVVNLVRTIEELKQVGLWIAGAAPDARDLYTQAPLTGPLGLVIGGEGKGLSRLAREKCDFTMRLPMRGQVQSLNAAVAGAVLLYEIVRQRSLKSS